MQWLVGWFWGQGKKGVCISKKVHCGPMHISSSLKLLGQARFEQIASRTIPNKEYVTDGATKVF